jgi:ClpX C4-type zinc finger
MDIRRVMDVKRLATLGSRLRSRSPGLRCSFCGRDADAVARLVAGASAHICDQCITKWVAVPEAAWRLPARSPNRDGAREIG